MFQIKNRICRLIFFDLAVITTGLGYYCFIRFTDISIPCLFHFITGWKCPLCGLTTIAVCILDCDLIEAYKANPVLFFLLPLIIIYHQIYYITKGKEITHNRVKNMIMLLLLTAYGIARNIFHF